MRTSDFSAEIAVGRKSLVILFALSLLVSLPSDHAFAITVTDCVSNGDKTAEPSRGWSLTTLPVGHGDVHVLGSPDGEITVVDAGSTESVDTLITWLEDRSIDRIDRIVVTHPHWDHVGGVAKLLDRFAVGIVLQPGLNHKTELTARVRRKRKNEGVPVRHLARGETFSVGSTGTAHVIHPDEDPSGGLNQNSLVFFVETGRTTLLMMGDVHGPSERKLLENQLVPESDLLKVAHHGNADGTSRRLLETVDPSMAVLPAPLRKNDPWGKPDPALVDRLQEFGVPTFHTGRVGTVDVSFDTEAIRSVRLGELETCSRPDS